jgi:hypothetical protein
MTWSDWMPLPLLPAACVSGIGVAINRVGNTSGRMMAFVIGADGALYRITDSAAGLWEPWVRSAPSEGQAIDTPRGLWPRLGLGRNQDGLLEVFAVSKEMFQQTVWHSWQRSIDDDGWSDWAQFYPGPAPFETLDLYVGSQISQLARNSGWGGWTVAAESPLPISIDYFQSVVDRHGGIQLFGRENGGGNITIWPMREVS